MNASLIQIWSLKGADTTRENVVKNISLCWKATKWNCLWTLHMYLSVWVALFAGCSCGPQPRHRVSKCNFWLRFAFALRKVKVLHEREPSPWTPGPRHSGPVFCSSRFSLVNEEDRRGRGLLVLIYPEGSLGITINSQLLAHSTRLHRHCQFVPIREAGFWVSAVRSRSGPTGESDPDRTGLGYTLISWGVENSP